MSTFDEAITAVYQGDYRALSSYFSDCDPSATDGDGRTLLMHAVLASDASPQMVEFLLDHGVPVDAVDRDQGWSALHFAARDKRSEIVDVLVQRGARVDLVECYGNTPLARSLDYLPYDASTIAILINAGADPSHKNH